jgi:uncharacterized protein
MINKEYELALEAAENKINSFNQRVPAAIRRREEALFQKIINSPHDPLTTLELFFSELDVIHTFVHQFAICKKGCNYCCQYGISISPLEVEYILKRVKLTNSMINDTDSKCLFMTAGICSIYAYRPYFCRRHLAFYDSPEWCDVNIAPHHRFPNIDCGEIDKCYAYLIGPDGKNSLKDIRQAFASPGLESWRSP